MSTDTATRTVRHALFDYQATTADGRGYPATALRGDVIEVNDADRERGERLGALIDGPLPDPAVPAPATPLTPDIAGGSVPSEPGGVDSGLVVDPSVAPNEPGGAPVSSSGEPERPKTVAKHEVWVDFVERLAAHHGDDEMTPERAQSMTKEQLQGYEPPAPSGS